MYRGIILPKIYSQVPYPGTRVWVHLSKKYAGSGTGTSVCTCSDSTKYSGMGKTRKSIPGYGHGYSSSKYSGMSTTCKNVRGYGH